MTMAYQTLIEADALNAILHHPDTVILDCRYYLTEIHRGRQEYLHAHIPGAYYLDIGHDLSAPVIPGITGRHPLPHPDVLTSTLRSCGLRADSQVIVYDQHNGAYASRAWWLLQWLGHTKTALLNGGFSGWISSGFETDNAWPPPKKGDFQPQIQPGYSVSMQDVASGHYRLVDSREYRRYTGEIEPIDPIAGHIPGAMCLPYQDNVDEQGRWKSREWLQEKFSSIPYDPADPPVFYCGSGVTACHNLFAYQLATGHMARLYPGSFSEWLNYHPVATEPTF